MTPGRPWPVLAGGRYAATAGPSVRVTAPGPPLFSRPAWSVSPRPPGPLRPGPGTPPSLASVPA